MNRNSVMDKQLSTDTVQIVKYTKIRRKHQLGFMHDTKLLS